MPRSLNNTQKKKPLVVIQSQDRNDRVRARTIAAYSHNCSEVARIFLERGYDVLYLSEKELELDPKKCLKKGLSKETPCKGTVSFVRKCIAAVGAEQPKNLDMPMDFRKPLPGRKYGYAERKLWNTTLGEIRRNIRAAKATNQNYSVFIKPLDIQKGFCGFPVNIKKSDREYDDYGIGSFSDLKYENDDYGILAQDVCRTLCNNEGERFYVLYGKVFKEYRDESYYQIKAKDVQPIVDSWKHDVHDAYVIDVVKAGRNKLIVCEVNEVWSAGLASDSNEEKAQEFIFQMMIARWKQMMAVKKNKKVI